MGKTSKAESAKWLQFRDAWIKHQDLICGYCGRDDLLNDAPARSKGKMSHLFNRIKGLDPERIATVDHIHPQAKDGPKYDTNNFIVSCQRCNQMKADYLYDEWIEHMEKIVRNSKIHTKKQSNILIRIVNLFYRR